MDILEHPIQSILGLILILSSLGVILARKPVHATLSFLLTLITLAVFYLELDAQFIAVMQIWVYAGAILVIFMFVIILFQDAHEQIAKFHKNGHPTILFIVSVAFLLQLILEGERLIGFSPAEGSISSTFGTVQSLGKELYTAFFFPFEAVVLLFTVAVVGGLFIGKKEKA